jgi:small subunit ribosomal protein S1
VVTFGAFVEILPGVEGLVHISELAAHHVENPREVVSQGDPVNVLVLEIDGERRRLSLSLKRVEEGAVPLPRPDGAPSVHDMPTPDLKLSEEAFPQSAAAPEALEDEVAEAPAAEAVVEDAVADAVAESDADAAPEPAADDSEADASGVEDADAGDEPSSEADAS